MAGNSEAKIREILRRTIALVTFVVAFWTCGFGEENSRAVVFKSLPDIFIPCN